jgi:transcriptional regulator with XRE-family HTH domain
MIIFMMEQNNIYKKFGFNVKVERMRKNYTQANLAELMNVNARYIVDIENGKHNVTLKTIEKIATALDVNVHKLMYFE